jgi:UDP-N-acetylmuramate dehydrogenase
MPVLEYVNISDYCTFRVGGQFRYFAHVANLDDLKKAHIFAREKELPLLILGGGSNMVFPDGVVEVLAVKIEILGFDIVTDTRTHTDIKIGAGEDWDSVVERSVQMNLSGIEALSAIPGTVGATPVQNVGAYGQEIKDTLVELEVYDREADAVKIISNVECHFAYRESIFKHEVKGRYIIISITLRLLKALPTVPDYPGVKKYFQVKGITVPTLQEIRQAITDIRSIKLPNPKKIANVGSFFKNPIVDKVTADKLKHEYPNLTIFPISETKTKVPAGFLIEAVGLKGKNFGSLSIYPNNALVLVNMGTATRTDVICVKDEIIRLVFDRFGIILEVEPEMI